MPDHPTWQPNERALLRSLSSKAQISGRQGGWDSHFLAAEMNRVAALQGIKERLYTARNVDAYVRSQGVWLSLGRGKSDPRWGGRS